MDGGNWKYAIVVQAPAVLAHSAEGSQIGRTAQTASGLQNRRSRVRVLPPLPNTRYESGTLTVP